MIQVEPTTDHGSGRIVKDFSTFCENDVDPSLGKKIGTLIDSSKDYIIYLDEDYFVQWSYTEAYDSKVTKGFADIANRVRFLETLSRSELRDPQIDLFAGLLAEAMARKCQELVYNGLVGGVRPCFSDCLSTLVLLKSERYSSYWQGCL